MLERWTTSEGKELSEEVLNEGNASAADRADVIDLSLLASLRDIEGSEHTHFVTDLIDLFLDETESQLKGLHAVHSQNDDTAFRQLAHHIRGSSGNVGATQMVVLLGQLEESGRSNGDTETLLGKLEQEFELVRAALTAERRQ